MFVSLKYKRPLSPPTNLVELDGDERSYFFKILSYQPEIIMRDILEASYSLWDHCDSEWTVYLLGLVIPASLLEGRINHPIFMEIIRDINSAFNNDGNVKKTFKNRWSDVDEALWVKLYFWLTHLNRYGNIEAAKEAAQNVKKLAIILDFELFEQP